MATTVAAAAFVGGLAALLLFEAVPWSAFAARSLVVGSGTVLSTLLFYGFYHAMREEERARSDARPLVTVHPRRWNQRR
jgi:hypothetical protein